MKYGKFKLVRRVRFGLLTEASAEVCNGFGKFGETGKSAEQKIGSSSEDEASYEKCCSGEVWITEEGMRGGEGRLRHAVECVDEKKGDDARPDCDAEGREEVAEHIGDTVAGGA